jgi:anti-sigma regulatory factor (Ser/Thr protein kinase)
MRYGPALIDGSPERRFQPAGVSAAAGAVPETLCDIRLTLTAHVENVVLIRHVVGALAEAAHLPVARVHDVRLAVTEACTNVVRHAYPDEPGRLELTAAVGPGGELTVIVSDDGPGFRPRPPGTGLGLPLMAAVAHEFEIDRTRERGTQVRMSFCGE